MPALASLSHIQRKPHSVEIAKVGCCWQECRGRDPSSPVFSPGAMMRQCGSSGVKSIVAKALGGSQGHSGQILNNTKLSPLGYSLFLLFKTAHEMSNPSVLIRLSCYSLRESVIPFSRGVPWSLFLCLWYPWPSFRRGVLLSSLTIHPGRDRHQRRQVNRMRLVLGR